MSRFCRHVPSPGERLLDESQLASSFTVRPPALPLYGIRVAAISQPGRTQRLPLSVGIGRSLGRVLRLKRLADERDSPDSGGRAA